MTYSIKEMADGLRNDLSVIEGRVEQTLENYDVKATAVWIATRAACAAALSAVEAYRDNLAAD